MDPLVPEFGKKGVSDLTGRDISPSLKVVQGSPTPPHLRRFRRIGGCVAALVLAAAVAVVGPGFAVAVSASPEPLPVLETGEPTFRYIVTAASPADRVSLVASLGDASVDIRDEFTEVLEGVAVSLSVDQYLALKGDPRVESISRDARVSLDTTVESGDGAASKDGDVIPGRYIIQTKPSLSLSAKSSILGIIGDGLMASYTRAITGYAAALTLEQVDALRAHRGVTLVEPDRVVRATGTQSNATWGLDRLDQRDRPLNSTFSYLGTGSGVNAYVIDTGIAPHADFGNRVASGYYVSPLTSTVDANGHGTHVAGTIAGTTWGVAKEATLVPVRVLDASGSGSTSGVISGINWVIGHHQSGERAVANLSLGGGASSSVDLAIRNLVNDGVVTVVAAGNSSLDACGTSPAREPMAVTVGATTSADVRASFSNYGKCLDIFAPGQSITSTWLGGATSTISGTSMASPHVAGAVASVWSENPLMTRAEVTNEILDLATVGKVSDPGSDSVNKLLYLPPDSRNPPGAPTGVSATLVSGDVSVAWQAPSSVGDGPITSYEVVSSAGVATCSAPSTSLSCTGFGLSPGTYQFKVRATNAYGSSEYSTLSNSVEFTGVGDNNFFVGRQTLMANAASVVTSNVNATREPSEPTIGFSSTYRTLWYSFTPDVAGTLTLDLAESSFDTVLAVYTGSELSSLTKLDENDDENFSQGVLTSKLSLRVESGVEYKVQVGSYWDTGGTIRLATTFVGMVRPEPPTDVVGTPGDERIFVSWSPPASHPELVTRYVATAQPGLAQCEVYAPTTSCLLSSLTNGVTYSMSVVAINSEGTSDVATAAESVTPRHGSIGPRPAQTWGLDRIDGRLKAVDGTYSPPADGENVRIYIVDTGVRSTHQDFTGRVVQGISKVPGESSTEDCHGHGTHVASSAAGATLGVAAQATIVPVRVLDCFGSAYTSEVIAGLEWVAQDSSARNVPAVVNMSLGGSADAELDAAVEALVDQGISVVVAAGNETEDACTVSPARAPGAITVGATTLEDAVSSFSNMGKCVDVFAPGSKILGAGIATDTEQATLSGTSMASPHVAGYAAVILEMFPLLTVDDVARAVTSTATTNVLSGLWSGSPDKLLYVATSKCVLATIVSIDCTTGAKVVVEPAPSPPSEPSQPVVPSPSTPVSDVTSPTPVSPGSATTAPSATVPVTVPSVVTVASGDAQAVTVSRSASRSAASAPRVTVSRDVPVSLRVPGLPRKSQPAVTVKSRHGSVDLGRVKVSGTGRLRLPKLSFARTGVYTFSFTAGKRTFFTKVSVVRPLQTKVLGQRSVTVVR